MPYEAMMTRTLPSHRFTFLLFNFAEPDQRKYM